MEFQTLKIRHDAGIDVLTLHRPAALNAFTAQMGAELIAYFRAVNARDEVRAVVVTGEGRAFCAGADIDGGFTKFIDTGRLATTLADLDARYDDPALEGVRDLGGRCALAIYDCRKPVIAAINGPCVGVGATLTLPMDARIASDKARIGFVFGRVGIVPEACSSWFLPRLVGLSRALEWCYSARVLDAQEALAGGLLREVVAPDALVARAVEYARSLVEVSSPVSIALIRQMLLRNGMAADPHEAHKVESLALLHTMTHDGEEGTSAFLQKRPANFVSSVAHDMPPFFEDWIAGRRAPPENR